jgi:hypothetical protein
MVNEMVLFRHVHIQVERLLNSLRPPVRMKQLENCWTDFHEICMGINIIYRNIPILVNIGQWTFYMKIDLHFYAYLEQLGKYLLEQNMFRTQVVEKNERILFFRKP